MTEDVTPFSAQAVPPGDRLDLPPSRLEEIARKLRCHIISMIATAGSGHPGGSLSAADILAALYFHVMRHRPQDPHWSEQGACRSRVVCCSGREWLFSRRGVRQPEKDGESAPGAS